MNSKTILIAIIVLLHLSNVALQSSGQHHQSEHHYEDRLPESFHLEVCDNAVVRSIPGGASEVLRLGKQYLESMRNKTEEQKAPFNQRWKWEVFRMAGPTLPECTSFKQFGDVSKNFDETKRFCDITSNYSADQSCTAYSLGSNNKWFFEEHMHKMTKCNIEAFDCTCNATIPDGIVDRTAFYKYCVGSSSVMNSKRWNFVTYMQAMEMINNYRNIIAQNKSNIAIKQIKSEEKPRGPEYLKIDVEGYEWSFLRSLVVHNSHHPESEHLMPLQIYGEFHLAQDADNKNDPLFIDGYVGKKLRHFLDNLFIRGGYMAMYMGNTHQTRNTDLLFVKVLCHKNSFNSNNNNNNNNSNSDFVLTGKLRQQEFADNPIDTDSLGLGYSSPLASMGRKDSAHASLRAEPTHSGSHHTKPQAIEQQQQQAVFLKVDANPADQQLQRMFQPPNAAARPQTLADQAEQLARVRSAGRTTFGTTGSRPLDKPRTNFAVQNSKQIGHGPHPQDKKKTDSSRLGSHTRSNVRILSPQDRASQDARDEQLAKDSATAARLKERLVEAGAGGK